MKKVLFIPAICIVCASCGGNSSKSMGDMNGNSYGNNQMQSQPSDMDITSNIKQKLMADTSLSSSARMITVTTTNGVVTLTGNVASQDESIKVVNMVQDVPGVVSVDNQLVVSRSSY